MRSDFLGDCALLPGLADAVNAGLYLTPALDDVQMTEAIELPAQVFEGEVEPAVVKQLLKETQGQPDELPLLQHALMRFWELDEDKVLTLPEYEALGDLKQILNAHAEEVYAELDTTEQALAETLLRALTERGPDGRAIRRPCRVSEVAEVPGVDARAIIDVTDRFRTAGRSFLMPPETTPLDAESTVDITHEALIRQWDRLQQWTEDESEKAQRYQRLDDTARLHEMGEAALWREADLHSALQWRERSSPTEEWARRYGGNYQRASRFLEHSEAAEVAEARREEELRRREIREAGERADAEAETANRLRWFSWVLAVLVVLAIAASLNSWRLKGEAEEARVEAEAAKKHSEQAKVRADRERVRAEKAEVRRTEELFEAQLTHASLLAEGEDYAAARSGSRRASRLMRRYRSHDATLATSWHATSRPWVGAPGKFMRGLTCRCSRTQ